MTLNANVRYKIKRFNSQNLLFHHIYHLCIEFNNGIVHFDRRRNLPDSHEHRELAQFWQRLLGQETIAFPLLKKVIQRFLARIFRFLERSR